MANITLDSTPAKTSGNLPEVGNKAPGFTLVKTDLTTSVLDDYKGQIVLLNIFPSVNTGTCSASVRRFNQMATQHKDCKVLCISRDLPFSQSKFCAAEGIENVVMLSDFRDHTFGRDYGLSIENGAFQGLLARAVVIIDEAGVIRYTQLVEEIGDEPNYEAAIDALNNV